MSKDLDGLGCLGDMGWYNIRAALWAYEFELPQFVQACPGAFWHHSTCWSGKASLMHN